MILELSVFQIFFMTLSIIGLSFSILYLFIGNHNHGQMSENYDQEHHNLVNIHAHRKATAPVRSTSAGSEREVRTTPVHRTSVGRQTRISQPSMRVLEVDYKVVKTGIIEEITMKTISGLNTGAFKLAASGD